ncbi:MAG: hypothetical protein HC831_15600 [Chloroflexia bacterium]|nr:hypothetical protein [Chloroflexia bacterium]
MKLKGTKKTKIIGLIVILLLVPLSFYVILSLLANLEGFARFKITSLVVVAAVFAFAFILILMQLLSKKPAMIIDNKGLTDYSSPSSVGLIPWKDVTEIKEAKDSLKRRLILVVVKNPEEYIHKKGAKLSTVRNSYYQQFGSPIALMPVNFVYNTDQLINELKSRIS